MSSDIAIRVSGLGKSYLIYERPHDRLLQMLWRGRRRYFREFHALSDVNFEIKRGETVGIIGRNGSGKSTLLQILCGTLSPTTGTIEVNGRVAALLELGAGFNPEFSGRENVFLCASLYGLTDTETAARFDQIVAFADIGNFVDQPVKTYSSGMFVRLAFAIVAHVDADILVIDEALAVGDVFFVQKCMRFLRAFSQKGTLLFVSHDTAAVVGLCSRAIMLEAGRQVRTGTPKEVSEHYLALLNDFAPAAEPLPSDAQGLARSSAPDEPTLPSVSVNDFGSGLSRIVSVSLVDAAGAAVSTFAGGEAVRLIVSGVATEAFRQPMVGFLIKDRLGQAVFGDNTYASSRGRQIDVAPGMRLRAQFDFVLPTLQSGDYSLCVSIGHGVPEAHEHHHWAHDVLIIRSRIAGHCAGLFQIPMQKITLDALSPISDIPSP